MAISAEVDRITIVDNRRSEATRQWAEGRSFARVTYVDPGENRGFGGAVNFVLATLPMHELDWIVVVSDDAIVEERFRTTLDLNANDPKIGIIGPVPRREADGSPYFLSRWVNMWNGGMKDETPAAFPLAPTGYVEGRCLAVRPAVFLAIGTFDEQYFVYWEETDLCYRARAVGWSVLMDQRSSVFDSGRTSAPAPFSRYMLVRNRLYFIRRHGRAPHLVASSAALLAYYAPREFVSGASSQTRAKMSWAVIVGVLDGLRLILQKGDNPRENALRRFATTGSVDGRQPG